MRSNLHLQPILSLPPRHFSPPSNFSIFVRVLHVLTPGIFLFLKPDTGSGLFSSDGCVNLRNGGQIGIDRAVRQMEISSDALMELEVIARLGVSRVEIPSFWGRMHGVILVDLRVLAGRGFGLCVSGFLTSSAHHVEWDCGDLERILGRVLGYIESGILTSFLVECTENACREGHWG